MNVYALNHIIRSVGFSSGSASSRSSTSSRSSPGSRSRLQQQAWGIRAGAGPWRRAHRGGALLTEPPPTVCTLPPLAPVLVYTGCSFTRCLGSSGAGRGKAAPSPKAPGRTVCRHQWTVRPGQGSAVSVSRGPTTGGARPHLNLRPSRTRRTSRRAWTTRTTASSSPTTTATRSCLWSTSSGTWTLCRTFPRGRPRHPRPSPGRRGGDATSPRTTARVTRAEKRAKRADRRERR